jgi:hypothetical protein
MARCIFNQPAYLKRLQIRKKAAIRQQKRVLQVQKKVNLLRSSLLKILFFRNDRFTFASLAKIVFIHEPHPEPSPVLLPSGIRGKPAGQGEIWREKKGGKDCGSQAFEPESVCLQSTLPKVLQGCTKSTVKTSTTV